MSDANQNPWAARFEPLLNREEIRLRAFRSARSLAELNTLPPEVACTELTGALKQVFFPTQQCVTILERFVGAAYAHCLEYYSDGKAFLHGIYSRETPLPLSSFPVCLTGLAGVGKSELMHAFARLLPEDSTISVSPDHSPLPLRASWNLTVQARSGPKDLLRSIAGADGTPKNLIDLCRKRAFRDGIGLLTVDEFQFATQSASANTQVTQMLLSLGYVGLPFVYAANFSLLRRLMNRPQEDQHRLLGQPIVLLPELPEHADWCSTLEAQKAVAPDVLNFDPVNDALAIHHYTAGIKRAVVALFSIAYRTVRGANRGALTMQDLEQAYRSGDYTFHRRDAEAIAKQFVTNRCVRDDLCCPIDLPKSLQEKFSEHARKERDAQVAEAMLVSSMTKVEKQGYMELKEKKCKSKKTGNVVSMKKKSLTAEDLVANANWFADQL